jgi:hypothetical protein
VAAADGAATAASTQRGVEAPAVSGASTRAFGVAPIRIVLGVAGLAGATAAGLSGHAAFLAALGGVLVLVVIALGRRSRSALREDPEPQPVPPGAVVDPPWKAALLACVPSTVGVAALAAVSLAFSPALTAVLAGVLLGLGVLALGAGVELAAQERRTGVRLYIARGPQPAVYGAAAAAPEPDK